MLPRTLVPFEKSPSSVKLSSTEFTEGHLSLLVVEGFGGPWMSRVYEALRSAEQETKPRRAPLEEGEEESNRNAAPPTELAISEHSAKEGQPDPRQLQQQLGSLADRLEASRGRLEELIAQARQAQESAQGELERIQHKIEETGLEATCAAAKMRAEVLKELESLSRGAVEQAQQRIQEKAAAAVDRLGQAAESSLAAAVANSVSTAVERVVQEMAERFHNDLRAILGGFEMELQQKADRLAQSTGELMRGQADSSLERFGKGLLKAGEELGRETARQIADAKSGLERIKTEARAAVEQSRCESGKMVQELREAAARELKAGLEKQRDAMTRQLQKETGDLARAALDRLMASLGDASQVARESVYKQVGQAAAVLKEWQDQARGSLEADIRKSLEAFAKQMAELSAGLLEQHRRKMGLWEDDLQARMQQADQVLKGSAAGFQNLKRSHGK
jgi:pantothenate kinase type III